MRIPRSLALLLCVLSPVVALEAQPARETALGNPLARHAGEFSLIRTLRELPNGSVLIADPINALLTRLDPSLQRLDTLGRVGRGPGEYMQPDGIWALPGDSSLLVDLGNNRLTVIAPNGRLGKTQPMMMPSAGDDGPPQIVLVAGTDRDGAVWFSGQPQGDSVPVLRLDRRTQKVSRMFTIKGPPVKREEGGSGDERSVSISTIPMGARDGWAVTPNGTLYVVRAAGYRVEVIAPNGTHTVGPPTPFTRVSIGDAEKKEWQDELARSGGINVNVNDDGNGPVFQISRLRGNNDRLRNLPWPAEMAPFNAQHLFVDSRDRLWVRRSERAGRPAVYDVFDTNGLRVGTVRLPKGRTIVGMGAKGLYVVELDDNDLQYLERYALPI